MRAAIALGIAGAAVVGNIAGAQDNARSPESIECSRQADLQRLHGAERRDFRTKCMGAAVQPQPAPAKPPSPAPAPAAAAEGNEPLSREEMIAVREALRARWNAPGYAGGPIDVNIYLNPDGTLSKPPEIVSKPNHDPHYPAAIKTLKRAIVQAQPFSMLRKESYAHWKALQLEFDVRELR